MEIVHGTVDIREFGLALNGQAESAAWQEATDYCNAENLTLYMPNGKRVTLDKTWRVDGYDNFALRSGLPYARNNQEHIRFEGLDTSKPAITSFGARFVDFKGVGVKVRDQLTVPSWLFSDPDDRSAQNSRIDFTGCAFEGRSGHECKLFFDTGRMSRATFNRCTFRKMQHAIGRSNKSFNYQIIIDECRFSSTTGVPIWNPSGGYKITNNVFMGMVGGVPAAIGGPLATLVGEHTNNYMGDCSEAGTWVDAVIKAGGIIGSNPIAGASKGNPCVGINVRKGSHSVSIKHNRLSGKDLVPVNFETQAEADQTCFESNSLSRIRPPEIMSTVGFIQ